MCFAIAKITNVAKTPLMVSDLFFYIRQGASMMTFRSCPRTALACAFLLAGGMANAAPVVTNGSFEAPVLASPFFGTAASIPGWTHGGGGDGPEWAIGYADGGGSVTVAGSGNQFVTMGGGGTVGT